MPRVLRPVVGIPGYYIGNDGSVWSKWRLRRRSSGGRGTESYISETLKQMTLRYDNHGYPTMALRKDGKYHYFKVHQLVLTAFVGPCPDGMEGCHKDGNRTNNHRTNLYWGTRQQNRNDAIRLNEVAHGERNSQARLTEKDVLEIVDLLNAGKMTCKEIGMQYGISQATVSLISLGKNWRRVTEGKLIVRSRKHMTYSLHPRNRRRK